MRRDDVDKLFDYSVHVQQRLLYMGDEVDELMAEMFLKGMALLEAAKPDGDIRIIMNNIGGDEYHGLGIYDAIDTSKCHITITAYGHAMSMGSWILQAADDRVLTPNCTVMLHYGEFKSEGGVHVVRSMNKEFERLNMLMEQTYLTRMREKDPSITPRRLRKMLEEETYLTAAEAVELGLADRILS